MTSKRLFFRVMKEDMSHKIWIAALSVLGSFLAMPVTWLMWRSINVVFMSDSPYAEQIEREKMAAAQILHVTYFFVEYMGIMGGVLTIAVALVAGLAGFRYLFHRNMVDTYHSLPVKRGTLYWACYLNGILVWFLPFMVFWLSTVVMGASYIRNLGGGSRELTRMFGQASISFLTAVVIFLVVYHLVLTAVMLCGNALNTLVTMLILGFAGFGFCGMMYVFFDSYMDFFLDTGWWYDIIYAAPLVSAPELIYERVQAAESLQDLWMKFLPNFLMAVFLGLCAWLLYRRRISELAEQGVGSRKAAFVMKMVTVVVAGMCGWQIFLSLADRSTVGWGFFGAVLASVLAAGVLEVVFQMDFKAFFSHRIQMAAGVTIALFICSAFYWDWFGYDTYLPAKDAVAEIAICDTLVTNRYISYRGDEEFLKEMHIQDTAAAYAFLERMTQDIESREEHTDQTYDNVMTKVTLNSGRSYYRYYRVYKKDADVLKTLLTDRAYVEQAYVINEKVIRNCTDITFDRGGLERELSPVAFAGIVEAYNQDVLDDPEGVFLGKGRLLLRIGCEYYEMRNGRRIYQDYCLNIYETMEHTLEAVRRAGFGEWVEVADPAQIQSVLLDLDVYYSGMTGEERIEAARRKYGVYAREETEAQSFDGMEASAAVTDREYRKTAVLEITDPAELEELVPLLEYEEPYRMSRLFREEYIRVTMVNTQGEEIVCYIRKGVLPEKYILKFGKI